MAKFKYVGNPGYVYEFASGRASLDPGDTVDLTPAEARSVGDDFERVADTKSKPPTDDNPKEG